jgi:hypothetical protein
LGRVTRHPKKPKLKFVYEIRVSHTNRNQLWFLELLARVAGPSGYKKRTPFWAYTIFAFVREEQARELELYVGRRLEFEKRAEARKRACPVAVRYEEAALAQYAVIWGLSTGLIRDVVRTYRRERRDCSSHGHPNMEAAEVIRAAAPAIDIEKARRMVDAMLAWVIERHGSWFWTGLQGDRSINRY